MWSAPRYVFGTLGFFFAGSLGAAGAERPIDFSRDILPILSDNCFHCHGPDEQGRKAKLRLDTQEGAFRTVDGISPFVAGASAKSDAIERIFSTDADEVMPTPKSNRTLSPQQKQLLKRWVDEGAHWGQHWAFLSPKRPPVPGPQQWSARVQEVERRDAELGAKLVQQAAQGSAWAHNPIDHFVLERLLSEGLLPSPAADPVTLCRRLFLDLTGLPPTPEQSEQFVRASQSNWQAAVEALVDRLLESPRYGERMVWEWLEAGRYADTNGFQGDPTRSMWYWRDWAVQALNENLRFDQFTIEQLAGDLLENPQRSQLIATGFHRNHMINGEGGRIAEESRADHVQDRVESTGTVWMGLTLNCCRCHDHKFDPIKQREYYQLSAYFNSVEETGSNDAGGLAKPVLSLASPEEEQKLEALKKAEAAANQTYSQLEARLKLEQPEWEKALLGGISESHEITWRVLEPAEVLSDQGTVLKRGDGGIILASGPSPTTDDYVITAPVEQAGITAFKLEVLTDPSLVNQGPGRSENGNFVLSEISLLAGGRPVELHALSADFSQTGFEPTKAFDGDAKTGWAVHPQVGRDHSLIFTSPTPVGSYNGIFSFRLYFQFGRQHTLGRFRISVSADNVALLRPIPEQVRALVDKPMAERSKEESAEVTKYYLAINAQLIGEGMKRDAAKRAREKVEKELPRTMVMRDRPKPRDTFILTKGAYDKPAEKVEHGTPAALPALPADAPKNRLALAQWLVAPDHPLTARVTVNRYWQSFFGRGLVKSVDDFGLQGEKPTHPELLDWLAREFVDGGWDVKAIHRLILTSATYQQSSKLAPGMAERDPENQLLARGPRFRLPSWMLRDQALAISGLLVDKLGGPPVKVYQPTGVWEDASFGQIKYVQDHGEALYRRSLYVFWRRIVGPTLFFDVSNRQACAVKTSRTNTPLQALVTLNDVTYVEAARALAQRLLLSTPGDAARIRAGFRLCLQREPSQAELQVLAARVEKLRAVYRQDSAAAAKLIATGESKPDPSLEPAELAAWTGIGSVLLNLDQTLTKE